MNLVTFFEAVYLAARPQTRDGELTFRAAISKLELHTGRTLRLTELSEPLLQEFLAEYRRHWSAASTNNKRKHLLCLWRLAARKGMHRYPEEMDVPRCKLPRREPQAWTPEEYGRLLRAAWQMRRIPGDGIEWTAAHWRAFLLVQYDTAHRRGALLSYPAIGKITTRRDQVTDRGYLIVRGEHTKQRADATHKLHPDTIEAIDSMPDHDALFPWPRGERLFDSEYRVLLAYAGMAQDRKNGTHKNRRTSVTQVAIKRGVGAASMHARHGSEQVTRSAYIDWSQLPAESAADVMERPA